MPASSTPPERTEEPACALDCDVTVHLVLGGRGRGYGEMLESARNVVRAAAVDTGVHFKPK